MTHPPCFQGFIAEVREAMKPMSSIIRSDQSYRLASHTHSLLKVDHENTMHEHEPVVFAGNL